MARLSARSLKTLRAYIKSLKQEIPVRRAILFGSYARGEGRKRFSDVDIAIFSDAFRGRRRVDVIAYLVRKAAPFPLSIEPIGFSYQDYLRSQGDDFVRTIRREGIRIRYQKRWDGLSSSVGHLTAAWEGRKRWSFRHPRSRRLSASAQKNAKRTQ